jgi:uncharacterized membrane protein YqjE
MAQAPHDASTFELLRDLLNDVRTLVRQEIALARAELGEELRRLVGAVLIAVGAMAALVVAGVWLLIAVSQGLAALFGWPLWGTYGGVGLAIGAVGAVMALVAWRLTRTLRVLPKTRQSLREHAHWPLWHAPDEH